MIPRETFDRGRYSNRVFSGSLSALWKQNCSGEFECESSAPGRINLIGEHTDYNQGFVFPAAISRRTRGLFRISTRMNLYSNPIGPAANLQNFDNIPTRGWTRYVAACAHAIRDELNAFPPLLEGVLDSDLPSGSGLSSSAALEICLISAWNALCKFNLTPEKIAEIAWIAETRYVGVNCGKMDQLAVACGKRAHAMFIDTRSLQFEHVPIPAGIALVVLDTCKSRALAASAYNERVAQCRSAAETLGKTSLRDATLHELESARKRGMDETVYKRARHVITENERVLQFRVALQEADFKKIGELCRQSHESLRNDYNVSSPELDAMARSAWNAPGCIAARLTGAGFGGCCVALVHSDKFKNFERSVKASYGMYAFPVPAIWRVDADDGAKAFLR